MKDFFDLFNVDDTNGLQQGDDFQHHDDTNADETLGFTGSDTLSHTDSDFDLTGNEIDQINHHVDTVEHDPSGHHEHSDISFGSSCAGCCSNNCSGGCSGSCLGSCSGNCLGGCAGYCSGS